MYNIKLEEWSDGAHNHNSKRKQKKITYKESMSKAKRTSDDDGFSKRRTFSNHNNDILDKSNDKQSHDPTRPLQPGKQNVLSYNSGFAHTPMKMPEINKKYENEVKSGISRTAETSRVVGVERYSKKPQDSANSLRSLDKTDFQRSKDVSDKQPVRGQKNHKIHQTFPHEVRERLTSLANSKLQPKENPKLLFHQPNIANHNSKELPEHRASRAFLKPVFRDNSPKKREIYERNGPRSIDLTSSHPPSKEYKLAIKPQVRIIPKHDLRPISIEKSEKPPKFISPNKNKSPGYHHIPAMITSSQDSKLGPRLEHPMPQIPDSMDHSVMQNRVLQNLEKHTQLPKYSESKMDPKLLDLKLRSFPSKEHISFRRQDFRVLNKPSPPFISDSSDSSDGRLTSGEPRLIEHDISNKSGPIHNLTQAEIQSNRTHNLSDILTPPSKKYDKLPSSILLDRQPNKVKELEIKLDSGSFLEGEISRKNFSTSIPTESNVTITNESLYKNESNLSIDPATSNQTEENNATLNDIFENSGLNEELHDKQLLNLLETTNKPLSPTGIIDYKLDKIWSTGFKTLRTWLKNVKPKDDPSTVQQIPTYLPAPLIIDDPNESNRPKGIALVQMPDDKFNANGIQKPYGHIRETNHDITPTSGMNFGRPPIKLLAGPQTPQSLGRVVEHLNQKQQVRREIKSELEGENIQLHHKIEELHRLLDKCEVYRGRMRETIRRSMLNTAPKLPIYKTLTFVLSIMVALLTSHLTHSLNE